MASKPTRNNGSSPTNLSPSRPIRNSCSTSAAGRSTHGSNVIGGGSKKGTSNTSSSSPIGQGRPGLTPKTQRKELAPVQNSNLTPQGSPKINNNTTTGTGSTTTKQQKTSSSTSTSVVSRKNSSKNNNINKRSSSTGGGGSGGPSARPSLSHTSAGQPSSTQNNITTPTIKLREETKFDGLWEVKTIDNGLIRLPTQCLDNLISKEGIEKYYEVEPKPVAR